jgi:Tfp pilus assembly protein PilF
MKKESEDKTQDNKSFLRFNLLIALLCGFLILAHFFSSFFPKSRLWGINHLAYFPQWVRIIFTLLGLSVLIPWLNERVSHFLRFFLDIIQKTFFRRKYLWYLIFSLISMIIFYLLRDQTHFLGDGAQAISHLDEGKLFIKWTEPLEIFIHLIIYRFLNLFLKVNAETVYSFISIFSGAIFVYLLFLFSNLLGKDEEEGLLIFILLVTTGTIQLFFGYAEHYTLLFLAVFSYLYFSIRFLEKKSGFLPAVIFFILSVFSHVSAFYLFPSFFFLLWKGFEFKKKKAKTYFRWVISILSLILLTGVMIFYLKNSWLLGRVFTPLHPGDYFAPDYTLFSLSHFLDIFSLQFLLSPLSLVLILMILLNLSIKNKEFFSAKDKLVPFLLIVSVFQLGYNFLLNPGLGMARDWDLFSATALGYTILGIYLLLNWIKEKSIFKYVGTVLIFTSFLSTLPWVLINHSPQLSIQRFRNLLDLDVKKSRNGRYVLGQYFSTREVKEEVQKVNEAFQEKFPEISMTDEALKYYSSGKIEESIYLLQRAIQMDPGFAEAHNFLGLAYFNLGKISEAEAEYKEAIKLRPDLVDSYVNLGHLYTNRKQDEEAIKTYEKAIKLKTGEPAVYNNLGSFYLVKNKLLKAKSYIQKAISIQPNSFLFHFNLGLVLSKSGNLDEAEKELLKSIQLKEDYAPAHYNLGFIYSRKGLKEKALEEFELFLKYSSDETKKEEVKGWILKLRSQNP